MGGWGEKFQIQNPKYQISSNPQNSNNQVNPAIPPLLKGGEGGLSIFMVRGWPIGQDKFIWDLDIGIWDLKFKG